MVGIRLRELRREDWRSLRGVGYEPEAAAVRLPRLTCQAVAAQRGGWRRLCIPEAALSCLKISDRRRGIPTIDSRRFRSNFRSLVSTFLRHPDALQFLLAMSAFTLQF